MFSSFSKRKRVRKNADNALQDLSFRNLARLIMVDEQDIIKVTSPIHGGEATQLTAETNTFKLVLTGQDDSALVEQKKAVAKAELEGQLELLDKLSKAYKEELGDKPASPTDLNDQLERLTQTLATKSNELACLMARNHTPHLRSLFPNLFPKFASA